LGIAVWRVAAASASSLDDGSSLEIVQTTASLIGKGDISAVVAEPTPSAPAATVNPSGPQRYVFDTTASGTLDLQVASSRTHICTTGRSVISCYTKAGTQVPLGFGLPVPTSGRTSAIDFFKRSGFDIGKAVDGSNDSIKDGRIVFDPNSRRFLMVFQGREFGKSVRLFIAASKSEDPRDGWFTFADNVSTDSLNAHDYDWIGLSGTHLLFTNRMLTCSADWVTCKGEKTRQLMYPLNALETGSSYARLAWVDKYSATPATSQTGTSAFWVRRDDSNTVRVYGWRPGDVRVSSKTVEVDSVKSEGSKISNFNGMVADFGQSDWHPQNVMLRGGSLVWAAHVGYEWSGVSGTHEAVQVAQFNVSRFFSGSVSVTKQAVVGKRATGDPASDVWDYGMPAVSTTIDGSIVVGSVRVHPTRAPQLRVSVWRPGQSTIDSDTLLAASVNDPGQGYHMAGAAADPSGESVYLAQRFDNGSGQTVRVAKILGSIHPDLIAVNVSASPDVVAGSDNQLANVTIQNQGDENTGYSKVFLRLGPEPLLGPSAFAASATFDIPPLLPGELRVMRLPFAADIHMNCPVCRLGAVVDPTNIWTEYNELNNVNPFLNPDAGNYRINVMPFALSNHNDVPIPDASCTGWGICTPGVAESPIVISGMKGNVPSDLRVHMTIRHTFRGDLILQMVAPDGSLYNLFDIDNADSGDDVVATYVADFSGQTLNGTWKLRVTDRAGGDVGYIDDWHLSARDDI
jgi:subtilisin-like proprotein convertase family protein